MTKITHQWTISKLKKQYDLFRDEYFGNRVPPSRDVAIRWNGRLTASAGRCLLPEHGRRLIELSPHYHQKHPDEVAGTLLHEMIHLFIPGHGAEFKNWVAFLQERGEQVQTHARERATKPIYRYFLRCSNCGKEGRKYQRWSKTLEAVFRAPKKYRCRHCDAVGTLQVKEYVRG